jgi:hypothetical protein
MSEHQRSFQSSSILDKLDQIPVWQTAYEKAVCESDTKKLLTEIHATEEALFLRWQELGNAPAHTRERVAMEAAAEDLLAIKIHRLGWPDPCR